MALVYDNVLPSRSLCSPLAEMETTTLHEAQQPKSISTRAQDVTMATNSQNWPLWWRVTILANMCIYVTMGNYFTACISPLLFALSMEFRVDIADATKTITYVLLLIGLSNIFAVPISQYIGKRYTVLLGLSLFFACNVWCIYATGYNEFLAARMLGGLGAGIVEALGPLIVAECFPERTLASAMVAYVLALGAGASLGPFVAGLLDNGGYDWRWNFKISSIIIGVNLLSTFIMLPETVDAELQIKGEPEVSEKSAVITAEELDHANAHAASGYSNETLTQIWARRSFFRTLPDIKPERNFALLLLQPFTMLSSPAVSLTSITFGLMIAFTFIASVVLSTTLQSPPVLWSVLKIGLLNLSTLVGLLIGLPLGGVLADILSRRSARRNDGIHVRESRIPAIIPGAIIGPVGILLIGICLQQNLSWVGMAIGWAMLNIPLTASANVMLTYAVDCYPWRAADIGVVVNVLKNLVAFGVGYGVTPWLEEVGPEKQFGTMAGILWFAFLLAIPIFIFGARLRQWSLRWIL